MKKLSTSNIINLAFILISFLLLIYIFYRDFYVYQGEKNYFFYYVIILCTFIFFTFLLIFTDKIKTNIFIIIISSLVALYILEIVIFYFILNQSNQSYENFDKRTRFEVFSDMQEKNQEIYPPIFPRYFLADDKNFKHDFKDYFPLGNLSNKEILWCNENGYFISYKTDKYGFRNSNNLWDSDFIDFILIGDSYVEGACVNTEDTLSSPRILLI